MTPNADGGVYQSADLSRYSGTVVNRPTFFAFAKGAGVMGEAGPEAILPLRRGADGKLGVVADIGGSGMAMFAPQYNIEINNDGTNGQIGPAALKVVYDLGKKAAADFMQQQSRDVVCSPEVDDENLPLESETRYGCGFGPFRKKGALW